MLFSSLEFLYFFLPISLAVYYLIHWIASTLGCRPMLWQNGAIFLLSLIFYGAGEPSMLWLMLLTVTVDFFTGILIEHLRSKGKGARSVLILSVSLHLFALGLFKYYDPLAEFLGFLPVLGLTLPLGISFYIFQSLSYVIDVYRGSGRAQRSFVSFGAYVTLFPQLVAGPIVRYGELDAQLRHREHSFSLAARGSVKFLSGLSKKVLLANSAGALCELLSVNRGFTLDGWLWLILFSFQIYFDFSGYSDMAQGLGILFGFDLPDNFRYPYISKSITEFWRRWHMTLSSWFREYVYIPLGGNRGSRFFIFRNLLIVWALTGIWHGASWNFLLWGLYFFLLLFLEKSLLSPLISRLPSVLRHISTVFFILIGWLIFSSDGGGFSLFLSRFLSLFGIGSSGLFSPAFSYELLRNAPLLLLMALGSTPLPLSFLSLLLKKAPLAHSILSVLLPFLSLLLSTAYLVSSGYNPFLYFRF